MNRELIVAIAVGIAVFAGMAHAEISTTRSSRHAFAAARHYAPPANHMHMRHSFLTRYSSRLGS